MSQKQNFRLLDVSSGIQENEFKKNVPKMTDERLCEIIVSFRYLGIMQDESILAMEELANRRENGQVFDFENRINELSKDLPQINIDINKVLKTFRF